MSSPRKDRGGRSPRWKRYAAWGIAAALVAVVGVFIVRPAWSLWNQYQVAKGEVKDLSRAEKTRDFSALQQNLHKLSLTISSIQRSTRELSYLRAVPIYGHEYRDAQTALLAAQQGLTGVNHMMPALARIAPLLGYSTVGHRVSHRTGQARIQAFVKELPHIGPDVRLAYPDFVEASHTLNQISPQDFHGRLSKVGTELTLAKSLMATAVSDLPMVYRSTGALQQILGAPNPMRYLLIFQNSGELRATGGFMTAYGYVTLNHGKLAKLHAQNMYLLDSQVTYRPAPSRVIGTYLPVYYWHLRDANTSPDVPTTVSYINKFYDSIPNAEPVQGDIFIDTWFVDKLIGDVGGLTVPTPKGPVTLTASNANQKMEYMAEGQGLPDSERKKFISVMMKDLFHQVMHSRGVELARVLKTVNASLNQKFILLHFDNPKAQALVEHYHWGGVVSRHPAGDYLQVVDENLLGHKDNYYMHYAIHTTITKVGTRYRETTSMTYVNPAVDNNWTVVPYRSWVRFYVPPGSKEISLTGVDGFTESYTNTTLDKMVFGGHVSLVGRASKSDPPSEGTVTLKYWLPPDISLRSLNIQMQPGINHETMSVTYKGFHRQFPLVHDVTLHLPS